MSHDFTPDELAHAQSVYGLSAEALAQKIDTAGAQGTAYVWGWQDATGKGAHDTGASLDYGRYRAERVRAYYTGTGGGSLESLPGMFSTYTLERQNVRAIADAMRAVSVALSRLDDLCAKSMPEHWGGVLPSFPDWCPSLDEASADMAHAADAIGDTL